MKNQLPLSKFEYGFIENVDFTLHKFMEGKVWKHEYALTIDCAKEIAMVEGSEKGKQARRYFIECEKKPLYLPMQKVWFDEIEYRQSNCNAKL